MNEVKIKNGWIRGVSEEGYTAFRGIPYAAAPIGELRWKEPQPAASWEGIRNTFEYGMPSCQGKKQSVPGGDPEDQGLLMGYSEDCLYLNVNVPDSPASKLPVFVWIHGGAFCCGSGAGKNGYPVPYTKRGIIYVSFNYRLGLMGYFAHLELSLESPHHVSGNYAHFDQIAALTWVKDNIAAFGGDPDNITVGGCSAGAVSVQVLCNSPLAKGLFQRAIIMSTLSMHSVVYPEEGKLFKLKDMEERGVEYMKKIGCANISDMRNMSYEELVDVPESGFRERFHYGTVMGVNEDGYLLPEYFEISNEKGKNVNLPYICGCTHDEGGGYMQYLDLQTILSLSKGAFKEYSEEYLEIAQMKDESSAIRAVRETHLDMATTKAFAENSARLKKKPVYVYDFVRKHPKYGSANHGTCTQFLSDNYKKFADSDQNDEKVAETIQEYWCNFIRTGDPNGDGLIDWPPYSEENRKVLYLDVNTEVLSDYEAEPDLMRYTREVITRKIAQQNT